MGPQLTACCLCAGKDSPLDSDVALAYMGLRPQSPNHPADSSDPRWLHEPPPVPDNALSAPLPGTPLQTTPRS